MSTKVNKPQLRNKLSTRGRWAVNNAHASFVWEKQLTGASFPGISSLYASHNGQYWYFNDYP